jgi:predicted transcriptional regulator
MGRLTKKKIDEIAKLRSEGYTQSEVAQKTDVCLKTVRKYDPGSVSGSARDWRELQSLPERVKSLEEIVKTLSALAWSYRFEKEEKYCVFCSSCQSIVTMESLTDKRTGENYDGCPECGARISYAEYFNGPLADIFDKEA